MTIFLISPFLLISSSFLFFLNARSGKLETEKFEYKKQRYNFLGYEIYLKETWQYI